MEYKKQLAGLLAVLILVAVAVFIQEFTIHWDNAVIKYKEDQLIKRYFTRIMKRQLERRYMMELLTEQSSAQERPVRGSEIELSTRQEIESNLRAES